MEDREHVWPLSMADTRDLGKFLQDPNGSWLSADWNVQVDRCEAGVLVRTQRYRYHSPLWARCVYCGNAGETQGEAATLEPANDRGSFACKAADACQVRQAGADPVYVLGRLLRQVRAELDGEGRAQLASLAVDAADFAAELYQRLEGPAGEDNPAVIAERRDRAERHGRLF